MTNSKQRLHFTSVFTDSIEGFNPTADKLVNFQLFFTGLLNFRRKMPPKSNIHTNGFRFAEIMHQQDDVPA